MTDLRSDDRPPRCSNLGGDDDFPADYRGEWLNGIEWQVDAPWRLEPTVDPATNDLQYGDIPLVITIGDASEQKANPMPFERFCGIYVFEGMSLTGPRTYISPEEFHEIEAQRRWQSSKYPEPGTTPFHQLRRMWAGDDPDDLLTISDWAEWNATVFYTPTTPHTAGDDLHLTVVARVSRSNTCEEPAHEMDPYWLSVSVRSGRATTHMAAPASWVLSEFLSIHYGEAPLPRISDDWVYGDLHYHSQGTDNEGEMGAGYRGTLQAMRALGLDFAFATEHASDSPQLTYVYKFTLDNLPDLGIPLVSLEKAVEQKILDYVADSGVGLAISDKSDLRDMSDPRYRHLHAWLHAADGANAEVNPADPTGMPQMFLGGEIDVIPEMTAYDHDHGGFLYGSGKRYDPNEPCTGLLPEIIDYTDFEQSCYGHLSDTLPQLGHYKIMDIQGKLGIENARQHLIYLPYDGSRDDTFISGETGPWGGATRQLNQVIGDLERLNGYAFLAHPVAAASGNGPDRLGPDLVPYSNLQLETAFASPHMLGLQLWNEDGHYHTSVRDRNFPMFYTPPGEEGDYALDLTNDWRWARLDESSLLVSLHEGAAMWDQVLRWGITPPKIAGLGFLGADEPRRFFMAGGSDAHADMNYRRTGRLTGWSGANDTAIGKPRNLIDIGPHSGGFDQSKVIDALKEGRFSITDGPAIRIGIDTNGNNHIDAGEPQMGDWNFVIRGATVPVLVEWESTDEFGPVGGIDLYLGAQAGNLAGVTYAPQEHGMMASPCIDSDVPITDGSGIERCPMKDGYIRDDTGQLHFDVPQDQGKSGWHRFELAPRDFSVFDTVCTTKQVGVRLDDGTMRYGEVTKCHVDNVQDPERLYVRAFVHTGGRGYGLHHFAFSNPIWMVARPAASPPQVAIDSPACDAGTNRFPVRVAQGAVPGTMTAQYRVGGGAWSLLAGNSISAPGGQTVSVRAIACNANGCSTWSNASRAGRTCNPPPPDPPGVRLEFVACSRGTSTFVPSVWRQGDAPVASWGKQYKIGTGSWRTLTGATIRAGSRQRVYLRARACNQWGCSGYANTSIAGPYCASSRGGGGRSPL